MSEVFKTYLCWFLPNVELQVDRQKQTFSRGNTFRFTQEQIPAGIQPPIKPRHHFPLCLDVEIHECVAAGDQIQISKRGIVNDVVAAEHKRRAQVPPELKKSIF